MSLKEKRPGNLSPELVEVPYTGIVTMRERRRWGEFEG